ncbi:cell division suppressor protein YneA [Pullulanibacillus camelliae]|uniref:Cell division suppressor protein YneA n=1 Tax=Pullulanibacillus camelliae TaxID=1707096 RepID=A0A8J3DZW6_9BACL|nr:LysM peptidoglycan-binding domain-containing protein [Pullulanibacillus camelliae]GGE52560.1 cell division suppressor protein YneA [Pullulanibacillus camelliae]
MNKRKTIKNEIILYGLFIAIALGCIWAVIHALTPVDKSSYQTITVEKGDTLWAIAKKQGKREDTDISSFVTWVEKNNRIEGDSIHSGDKLVIPIKKEVNEMASQ